MDFIQKERKKSNILHAVDCSSFTILREKEIDLFTKREKSRDEKVNVNFFVERVDLDSKSKLLLKSTQKLSETTEVKDVNSKRDLQKFYLQKSCLKVAHHSRICRKKRRSRASIFSIDSGGSEIAQKRNG